MALHLAPDGATELKIPVTRLRSNAAELELVIRERQRWPRRFVAAHSGHVLKHIESARADADALRLQDPTLIDLRNSERSHGEALSGVAHALTQNADAVFSAVELHEQELMLQAAEDRL